jgi:hypothetical protein
MIDSFKPVDPLLVDFVLPEHDGYPDHLAAEDTDDALRCAAGETSREFPESMWIEPKQWAEYARDNDINNTSGLNYVDRFTDQSPSHECTVHSLTRILEACWNLQRGIIFPEGPKKGFRYPESELGSVWFSVLSVYAEANPGEWGGANVRQVLEIAVRRGILPDKIQPRDYGFKHTLHGTSGRGNSNQSSGPFVKVNRFPDGWQETAKHFKPKEVIFPAMWEQAVCLTLHRRLVGVGRNGHAIPWAQPMFKGDKLDSMAYPDSYNVIRYDSLSTIKSAWRGAFAVASMTTPDDWMKPAG